MKQLQLLQRNNRTSSPENQTGFTEHTQPLPLTAKRRIAKNAVQKKIEENAKMSVQQLWQQSHFRTESEGKDGRDIKHRKVQRKEVFKKT